MIAAVVWERGGLPRVVTPAGPQLYGLRFDLITVYGRPSDEKERHWLTHVVRCRLEPDGVWQEVR